MVTERSLIHDLRELVKQDFDSVNSLIVKSLFSDIPLIQQISQHIIHSGGKRLRPLLVLLSAKSLHYPAQRHIDLACIIEFLHTATLLHDDVVDRSELRRGRQTANHIWGNEASILVGDFLYSRAFQMMADLTNLKVISVLADATNKIASGEVLQLMHRNNPRTMEENYMRVIHLKTAKLFEVSAQLGAIIANASPAQEQALTDFGGYFGITYQLIDDILDFNADHTELGKNIGDDLAEGKPTLPLIYALQHSTGPQQALINEAILKGGIGQIDSIMAIIKSTGALEYTYDKAKQYLDFAIQQLQHLPDSPYRQALYELAHFALTRKS